MWLVYAGRRTSCDSSIALHSEIHMLLYSNNFADSEIHESMNFDFRNIGFHLEQP